MKQVSWNIASLLAGFALSFCALGILWIGTPWPYQFLISVPFFLVAGVGSRFGGTAIPVLVGSAPFGMIFVLFKDKDDSHLIPVLVVCAWVVGILLGHYLGRRSTRKGGSLVG